MKTQPRLLALSEVKSLLDDFAYRWIIDGTRLSEIKHRGPPCKWCKRPKANKLAREEFMHDGDAPDLCWADDAKDCKKYSRG